jgi:hypothetical protein
MSHSKEMQKLGLEPDPSLPLTSSHLQFQPKQVALQTLLPAPRVHCGPHSCHETQLHAPHHSQTRQRSAYTGVTTHGVLDTTLIAITLGLLAGKSKGHSQAFSSMPFVFRLLSTPTSLGTSIFLRQGLTM